MKVRGRCQMDSFLQKTITKGNFGRYVLGQRNKILERMFDYARKNGD